MKNKKSNLDKPMRFHWRLVQGGESENDLLSSQKRDERKLALPELDKQIDFCKTAEKLVIDSLLVDINYAKPDPILHATALACHCQKIKFIVAVRSGLLSPTLLTQQVNTFSYLNKGRILLNVVAGHSPKEQKYYGDFLPHDERYSRTEEFMEICNSFWKRNGEVNFSGKYFKVSNGVLKTHFYEKGPGAPYIFIAGGSAAARDLAGRQGNCWIQLANTPDAISASVSTVLNTGLDIGIRLCVIARQTSDEARSFAAKLIEAKEAVLKEKKWQKNYIKESDSESINKIHQLADAEWLTDTLWTGAVRFYGAPCIALVGSYDEVADAFLDYKKVGVTEFILAGWPKLNEMCIFGEEVLPRIREKEKNYFNHATTNKVQI